MNKNSVKQRIFLSNTLMIFALLAIFLLINLAVIKIYGESIEHQFVNNASAFLTETEWKNFFKTWTIRQNQFILLFILDGVVCIVTDLLLCNGLLKNVFGRLRPCQVIHNVKLLIPQPSGASFPSGHTSISFAAVGALYYSHAKKYATYCFIPASLIAISRLYLFVHYPTDILGGIFVGILSGYLGIRLVHYIENWRLKNLKNVALTS